METQLKKKSNRHGWRALFRTLAHLRLPWLWIILGLAVNLILNDLLLDLPDTTADLMSGQLSGTAVMKAIFYYAATGGLSFLAVVGLVQAQSYSVKRARETVWNKMLHLQMSFFDRNDPTDLMSAITNDVGSAVQSFANVIVMALPSLYYVIMAMKRITEYHWILTLSCFAVFPLKFLYVFVMGRQFQKSSAHLYGKIGVLTGFLADRIQHLSLIKAYTNEDREKKAGEEAAHKLMRANMKLVHLDNIASAAVAVIDILQKFVVIVVAVVLLQQGKIDVAMWLAFFLFSQTLFSYVDQVFDVWVRIKGIQGEFHRIIEIMDGAEESTVAVRPFPKTGDILFEDVTFTYPETAIPALQNVTFTVPRGSSVAIVGLCGSGKTTAVSLLERLYQPEKGRIFIGETVIDDISLADYRRNLAYVPQGSEVFGGTLREALTYGIDRAVTDEEILSAAEKTGFGEYVQLCSAGLDTEVSGGGLSMSGGQSQRLVLTRELLRGGEIILLDEPTSALDVQVSAKIQETVQTLFADKTRILVTHDLDYARKQDLILVMREGFLVGEGTHDSLLRTCETYREMNENAREEAAI